MVKIIAVLGTTILLAMGFGTIAIWWAVASAVISGGL